MSSNKLDQIVKGAPSLGISVPTFAARSVLTSHDADFLYTGALGSAIDVPTNDLLSSLPSSPPQIYLNLLILEASLRSQYLILRGRRRQHTFFLLLLGLWITYFFYALFLRPREDGSGVGGSVYWVVEMAEKMALMGGIVTGILIWGTGQWERGVRWPRRFVGVANRGLRNINTKIVIMRGPWWKEVLSYMSFLFPYSSLLSSQRSSFHYIGPNVEKHYPTRSYALSEVEPEDQEEDLEPGGDHIKLLLLPKPFSAEFRENWDLYRSEYWEKENERRMRKRRRMQTLDKQLAVEHGGWFWWISWRSTGGPGFRANDIEKRIPLPPYEQGAKQRHQLIRSESHSRNASRSSTPSNPDIQDQYPPQNLVRRGSAKVVPSEQRKKAKLGDTKSGNRLSRLTSSDAPSTLFTPLIGSNNRAKRYSSISSSSGNDSDR